MTAPSIRAVTTVTLWPRRGDPCGIVDQLPSLPARAMPDVRLVLAAGARHLEPFAALELAEWLCSGAARVVVEGTDPTAVLAELLTAIHDVTTPPTPARLQRDVWGLLPHEVAALTRRLDKRTAAA